MQFILSNKEMQASFVIESSFTGVHKIGTKVCKDMELVTGKKFSVCKKLDEAKAMVVFVGTVGSSSYLEQLEQKGVLDLSSVVGKREVYSFTIVEDKITKNQPMLVIAGSDKRGTIYGLFHLSEILGVSPWIYWADVMPVKQEEVILTEDVNMVSKEPSVKYRGFFINDEWPSFGNWTMEHHNGFTTQMYDHVFELLLRLKGNYLWPAMWTSNFSLDGPGLTTAQLADEYGIVMSNSHHEPCLRHSEEWDLVRGEKSPYGNQWNFDQNKEGLANYWRDGLKRNGNFENIITIGMRGERDSTILGHDASLNDNINYLKEVITTQNQLIAETINEDLSKVPRMLALYKEVEAYYYGDENTTGLNEWKELDGVTLMLCEDNFGNMRTLPTEQNRNRPGGWGMYYHFDYHGGPVSYEWVNSTYLAKVWEQMTQAYESGIRDIWVVNVGDLKPQELPLSYFLDLAYDYDKWGIHAPNQTQNYMKQWIQMQFASSFDKKEEEMIFTILDDYTWMNHIRKPETLQPDTYHPVHYGEADWILQKVERIQCLSEKLRNRLKNRKGEITSESQYAAFYELVYYPAVASANLVKMQIYAGKNALYAKQGRKIANSYADKIAECIKQDRTLVEKYHCLLDGKWNGMMQSEHIGFTRWNDEECQYPLRQYMEPANKPRMIVSLSNSMDYTMGGDWTRKTLRVTEFTSPYEEEISIDIANGSKTSFHYEVSCDVDWIELSQTKGIVEIEETLIIKIDRKTLSEDAVAHLMITSEFAKVNIEIEATYYSKEQLANERIVSKQGLAIEANEYSDKASSDMGEFQTIEPYGKYFVGEKAFPIEMEFVPGKNAPVLTYDMYLLEEGEYELTILSAPSNPTSSETRLCFGAQWNEEPIEKVDTVSKEFLAGEDSCQAWAEGVLDNIRATVFYKQGTKGKNQLKIYACDPGFVLERILITRKDRPWKKGFMGRLPKGYA